MRRLIILCITLCVLASLSVRCFAVETPLEMPDVQAKAGQTVYLAITLKESVEANTLGVKCEFDKTLLTALPELSTWGKEGVLAAFKEDNIGAWTTQTTGDMKGKLCVLAFQVNEGVAFPYATVKCNVVLKNSEKEVGNYTVEGSVISDCEHSYGDWQRGGKLNHIRICSICGGKNSQPHQWDQGTESKNQQGSTLVTKTCTVCLQQDILEISPTGEMKPVEPDTKVESTTPSQGTEHHDHLQNQSTQPSEKPNGSQNENDPENKLPTEQHSHKEDGTASDHTHSDGEQELDHNHTVESNDPATPWVIFGVIALMFAGAVFYVKKKK